MPASEVQSVEKAHPPPLPLPPTPLSPLTIILYENPDHSTVYVDVGSSFQR